jgi:phenylpropionate dioxygenase-like ring-hydroxylating dioxygenase large terminal subunit
MSEAATTADARSSTSRRGERYKAAKPGLTEYWYPVMTAARLRRKRMVAQAVAGQDILFVFDKGRYFAVRDLCPHRLVPLSVGRIEFPGHVTCEYHGWTFDLASGQLVAALTDGPDSPITGKVCIKTYPVEVRAGLVFVWIGSSKPVPVEDDIPAELFDPRARIMTLIRRPVGDWRYAAENGFDEAHGKMLHRSSWWVFFRGVAAWNTTEIKPSPDGIWLSRSQRKVQLRDTFPGLGTWPTHRFWQRGAGKTRATVGGADHVIDVRLPGILRVKQPGRAKWTHYEWYVPSDDERYLYVCLAVAWPKSFIGAAAWWLRYWTYILWVHHYGFNGQDLQMVKLMPESHPVRAFRPDESISSWRKLVEERARGFVVTEPAVASAEPRELRTAG